MARVGMLEVHNFEGVTEPLLCEVVTAILA